MAARAHAGRNGVAPRTRRRPAARRKPAARRGASRVNWDRIGRIALTVVLASVRYSYLNLNDGPVQGGVMTGTTVGLNWYWNPNMKWQFDYLDDNRYHKGTAAGGTASGNVQGFGTRMQIQF